MELECAKQSSKLVEGQDLRIDTVNSDRHKGITKRINAKQKENTHFKDTLHLKKSSNKNLRKASKEKRCERINDGLKGICIHLY